MRMHVVEEIDQIGTIDVIDLIHFVGQPINRIDIDWKNHIPKSDG